MGIQERKEREKEHRREEILNAAQKVFFEKGLLLATMDEIAEAAELSKGTLYLYYKSKEDMYLAVMMRGMETLYEMLSSVLSEEEPTIIKIRKMEDIYFRFFQEHRNFFRMLHYFQNPQLHKQVSPEMMDRCNIENQKLWKIATDVFQQGIEEGTIRADLNPAECVVILWSSATAIMMRIDTQYEHFKETLHIDLEQVRQKSNALLLESMMTESAKQQYQIEVNLGK